MYVASEPFTLTGEDYILGVSIMEGLKFFCLCPYKLAYQQPPGTMI